MSKKKTNDNQSTNSTKRKDGIKCPKAGKIVWSLMNIFKFSDIIFYNSYCTRDMFCCYENKCCCDEETDKFVLECCKYYLHRLENCWVCSEEENKQRIKVMANKILNNLSRYIDKYANNNDNLKKEIMELKKTYRDILDCEVSEV
ncbi:MAG: hypothetical protein J6Y01_00640 [Spirochaetales bacterium]|nr:hypothetical protein [Spirochaetales bacterium]